MVNNPKFRCLVEADAKAILDRQETDSIDIIDEIRYVLRTCNLTTSGIEMGSMVSCAARVYLFLYLWSMKISISPVPCFEVMSNRKRLFSGITFNTFWRFR